MTEEKTRAWGCRGAARRRPGTPRRFGFALLLTLPWLLGGCGDKATGPTGQLEVAVYLDGRAGEADKQIEIVGASQLGTTNDAGLVTFTLAEGRYVVRAYGIGTPGPASPYQEQTIGVTAGKTVHVEFFDCSLCQ